MAPICSCISLSYMLQVYGWMVVSGVIYIIQYTVPGRLGTWYSLAFIGSSVPPVTVGGKRGILYRTPSKILNRYEENDL